MKEQRNTWQRDAENRLLQERSLAAATPLRELVLPALPGRRLIFKDESAHPTGSLKHRLARALLLQGLRIGAIDRSTPLFDASSGNTAVSEAWFAKMLGLSFFSVIPATTSPGKQALIRRFGGECVLVDAGKCCKQEAARLARQEGGYFLDQFTNAARAVDWREHNVIVELFAQLHEQSLPDPDWFVVGAGTGGTATTAGRYFRNTGMRARLMVVDPEDSAFHGFHSCGTHPTGCLCASRVEGIGRPTVEPSFNAAVVDSMTVIPDAASFAAARWLSGRLNQRVGVSTGTNLIGTVQLLDQSCDDGVVATLICDEGERYAGSLDDASWLASMNLDVAPWEFTLQTWFEHGHWNPPQSAGMALHAAS